VTIDLGHRQLSLDIEEEVFRHLLFHKSLIDDSDEEVYGKLEKYLKVLSDLKEEVHITIKDSYSRSIAMILELATESYLDPWDVDLVRFCKMFMKKLRNQERFNLIVIGKLIRMAYSVLYLKSSDTLRKAEMSSEDDFVDEDPFYQWMDDDETFEVTKNILKAKQPVLMESVVHKGDRPVTLVDLLNALEEVGDEVEILKQQRREHLKAKKMMDKRSRDNINEKVYMEHTEEDIRMTWQRVNQFNGHPIPFSQIDQDFELDANSTFISLLYLANWDKVKVWQRAFPRGEIMVKNIANEREDLEYGDLDENLKKAQEGEARIIKPDELIIEEKPIPSNWNT
jgi:chromatin segregation and condensation protein Rec8/ScpA/Scc1 (kleisin family)